MNDDKHGNKETNDQCRIKTISMYEETISINNVQTNINVKGKNNHQCETKETKQKTSMYRRTTIVKV